MATNYRIIIYLYGMSLRKLVKSQFDAFPSSGENNFKVQEVQMLL